MHENRETSRSAMSERRRVNSPAGEGQGRTTRAYDLEGSDFAIVPTKSPNKARGPMKGSAAEVMEGRAGAKENCECARTCRTQSRSSAAGSDVRPYRDPAENRILRAHLPSRLRLSDAKRSTLAEIAKQLGRKACAWRIHRVTRQSVSGTARDSASASDMRQAYRRPRSARIWQAALYPRVRPVLIEILLKLSQLRLQVCGCPE
jgi:hypothetical protein